MHKGWRIMWVLAVFDLPVKTKRERRAYTVFRKSLLKSGFIQIQYSVYIRHTPTYLSAKSLAKRLGKNTPPGGKTSFFFITDKQYGLTNSFFGNMPVPKKLPKIEKQLLFFENKETAMVFK